MSKIVQAVNAMLSNPSLINNVFKGEYEGEVFFKYGGKYNWSMLRNNEGVYFLSYYPGNVDLEKLAEIPTEHWNEVAPNCVSYNSKALATKEAKESLSDLYTLVNEKAYGMDEVLNGIIASDKMT